MKVKPTAAQQPNRPNVLLIMLDDLDVDSLDLLLAQNKLPNIQNYLLNQGTRCTNSFITNSACCPSRASFLTGQYSHNHGVETVEGSNGGYEAFHGCRDGLCTNLARPTLATWLSAPAVGYYTGFVGKYMNGYHAYTDQVPAGWDYWAALHTPGNGLDLRPNHTAGLGATYTIYHNRPAGTVTAHNPRVYQTKYIGDQGIAFLDEWAGSGHASFFLVVAPVAPHILGSSSPSDFVPGRPHPQFTKRLYADRPGWQGYCDQLGGQWCAAGSLRVGNDPDGSQPKPGFDLPSLAKPSFNQVDCPTHKPPWICENWADLNQNNNLANLRRLHLDRLESLLSVDVMIGQLIAALSNHRVLDNTLLIFTADNGFYLGEFRLGNKQHPHEASIAVPLLIRCPGQAQAAPDIPLLVTNQDLAPTILDFAGLPWSNAAYQIDGRSLRPLLNQQADVNWRKRFLVEHRYPRDFSWPATQGWLWNLPDYTAVRTDAAPGRVGDNQLYAEHYRAFDDRLGNVQYVEHYHMQDDPHQITNQNQNPRYDRSRIYLSSILNRLRLAQGPACRALEDEPAPLATDPCRLVDAVSVKNMYNAAGELTHFRQHIYAGGNGWYRDSNDLSHVWGEWRMLSLAESWGKSENHPPAADIEAAVVRDWYDAAGNPTSFRQLFYKKDGGPNGEDVWFRNVANPQIPFYAEAWSALNLGSIPWLTGNNRIDAAVFRPLFQADGRLRAIRQIFYVNAARAYYYRDSINPDGSDDPFGLYWPAKWRQGSYNEWGSHQNPPPTDRLDAVEMPIISANRRLRQMFYAGETIWWRDSAPNGGTFPRQWHSTRLEEHVKMGWPLQPTYPRPPISCTIP